MFALVGHIWTFITVKRLRERVSFMYFRPIIEAEVKIPKLTKKYTTMPKSCAVCINTAFGLTTYLINDGFKFCYN